MELDFMRRGSSAISLPLRQVVLHVAELHDVLLDAGAVPANGLGAQRGHVSGTCGRHVPAHQLLVDERRHGLSQRQGHALPVGCNIDEARLELNVDLEERAGGRHDAKVSFSCDPSRQV
eukprot:scaffold174784_cov28-Prasinocladus_malaysianus.AAC.2